MLCLACKYFTKLIKLGKVVDSVDEKTETQAMTCERLFQKMQVSSDSLSVSLAFILH